jgi:hypothetical protein
MANLGKELYLRNFRLPQLANVSIPPPNTMNDPISKPAAGFSLPLLFGEEGSSVEGMLTSGDFTSTLFEGKENSSVNTFPKRGVANPAATVTVKRMKAIFGQVRII